MLIDEKEKIVLSVQRFRNADIIQQKKDERDFAVQFARVEKGIILIVDGHHSFDAARALGANILWEEDTDASEIIASEGIDAALDGEYEGDSPLYNIETMEDL